MIELGGNIKLANFENLEPALLIVVKKIVGNYTKKISETLKDFKSIELSLDKEDLNKITVVVEADKKYQSEAKDKNLFFALNAALEQILKQ
ncbi:MAG: hypothetical protein AABX29_02685 [Nanoarchaeota archaeon]